MPPTARGLLRVPRPFACSAIRYRARLIDYRAIVETLREPLLILDGGLTVRLANPAFYRHFLVEPEDTVGRPLASLGNLQWDIAALRELLEATLERGEAVRDYRVEHAFERIGRRVLLLNARRAAGDADDERYVLLAMEDVTEREAARQGLQRANAELERTNTELERSNAELEHFAYVASHDLQEPLRMVASYTELLRRRYAGRLDERADRYIHYAVDGATRMQALINDLLTYSRVGRAGGTELVDAGAALGQAVENLRGAVRKSGAQVTHEPLPAVRARPSELVQVLQNLIGNAIKFRGDAAPRVHVSVEERPLFWEFSVRDNGIGIAPEYFGRIFVVFQRLHTREEYGGTGIGLALCRRIVEQHGGRIWVESEEGAGSTFHFTIPREEEGAHA